MSAEFIQYESVIRTYMDWMTFAHIFGKIRVNEGRITTGFDSSRWKLRS